MMSFSPHDEQFFQAIALIVPIRGMRPWSCILLRYITRSGGALDPISEFCKTSFAGSQITMKQNAMR